MYPNLRHAVATPESSVVTGGHCYLLTWLHCSRTGEPTNDDAPLALIGSMFENALKTRHGLKPYVGSLNAEEILRCLDNMPPAFQKNQRRFKELCSSSIALLGL